MRKSCLVGLVGEGFPNDKSRLRVEVLGRYLADNLVCGQQIGRLHLLYGHFRLTGRSTSFGTYTATNLDHSISWFFHHLVPQPQYVAVNLPVIYSPLITSLYFLPLSSHVPGIAWIMRS